MLNFQNCLIYNFDWIHIVLIEIYFLHLKFIMNKFAGCQIKKPLPTNFANNQLVGEQEIEIQSDIAYSKLEMPSYWFKV